MTEQNQRQTAVKLRISDITGGRYIKEEGWTPNYVITDLYGQVSRVNLLGTVVSVPAGEMNYRSIMIDDGSSSISIRSFDESDSFKDLALGDVVFVIGRPREFSSEIYIMPEIIKKVEDKKWIEVRKLEIENNIPENVPKPEKQDEMLVEEESIGSEKSDDQKKEEVQEEKPQNNQQKIYRLIKELDDGNGADFEKVIETSGVSEAEKIISQLLMEGEIFELSKGKLKVLE